MDLIPTVLLSMGSHRITSFNYAVYALDLQGQGQSEGERFYVQHINDHVQEVDQLIDIAKAAHQYLPLFVLGHSAGGSLVYNFGYNYVHLA